MNAPFGSIFRAALLTCSLVLAAGCQNVPKGPGVLVTVRAEPKTGYTPPDDPDQGYGGTAADPAQPAGHVFHRIDYNHLDGVLVWVEPLDDAARSSASGTSPMTATVDINPSVAARAEDFQVASVGGRIVVNGPAPKHGGAYIVRAESGAIAEVAPGGEGYAANSPGLVEILSDDADVPLATAYVARTPWARKTAQGKREAILLAGPGRYRVTVWHPILPGASQDVEVGPGQMANVTLTFGVNSLPQQQQSTR